jgi:glycosyltransferase involved in cell wall biosynthesis
VTQRQYNPTQRILVTGGAGFLGSHLCDSLIEQGHDVLCADNFFTGTKANIAHLLDHPRFELIRHDVTFPLYVEVDQIYNLAFPASPIHYQHDPVQTTKTSVHGAINMLGLAKRLRAKIFQASTSEVYRDPTVHPQVESYWGNVNPIGIRSCYLKILYLGRLEPIKAIHNLLHALALLPAAIRHNVHLDIYGGGSEEDRLEEIVRKQSISELVSFHGPVASDQVAQNYAKADLFVLPSEKEPWGLVVNEALLAGVPVMCPFWVGAAADLITDGETGYILENNTPACIAAGIERAYLMGHVNKQLGLRGRTRVMMGGWNVQEASAQLVTLIDEISRESHQCA